jgi:cytochrome P450
MTDVLAYPMPPVPAGGPAVGIRWLRRNIARFTNGPDHDRRRRQAISMLAGVEIDGLRQQAAARTQAALAEGRSVDLMAQVIPVEVLAAALGLPQVPVDTVAVIARAYQPDTGDEDPADEAVAELVTAFGGTPDEATAATIALLVQAYAATAGLVRNAARRADATRPASTIVAETLRDDPPVRMTRRVAPTTGAVITVDLPTPFGSGAHECPGRDHAVAIATGIVETLTERLLRS